LLVSQHVAGTDNWDEHQDAEKKKLPIQQSVNYSLSEVTQRTETMVSNFNPQLQLNGEMLLNEIYHQLQSAEHL
jgi:hypothetical protein